MRTLRCQPPITHCGVHPKGLLGTLPTQPQTVLVGAGGGEGGIRETRVLWEDSDDDPLWEA